MLRLLLFAPCEKVILDSEGLASIISIIENLEVTVPKSVQLPSQAAVPMNWQTISIWQLDQSENGKYEQMSELIIEDGTVAAHTEPIVIRSQVQQTASSPGAKIVSRNNKIPITDGPLTLKLLYRKIGDSSWQEAATYPISITVVRT